MGGLVSLTMALHHSNRFALCGALSPSLWWNRGHISTELRQQKKWLRGMRFWLDMGMREGGRGPVPWCIQGTRDLAAFFDEGGLLPGRDYYYQEVAGGEHDEEAWAARFDQVLLYFFGR